MNLELLERVRDHLPPRLNAGILAADGGFCILGWMLVSAGFHTIALYNNTISVTHPSLGGPAIDVVARTYGMPLALVQELAEINDRTETARRRDAVRAKLDEIIVAASAPETV